MAMGSCAVDEKVFQAERLERSSTFFVNQPIEQAFELFGPVREKEWAEGWDPVILFSNGADVEEHMVFQTPGREGEGNYTWTVTQYQPEAYLIEYTVFTSERVWFIRVAGKQHETQTEVTVTYSYTGLTEAGNRRNKVAIEKMFAHDLKDWEEAINYYIKTGKQLTSL